MGTASLNSSQALDSGYIDPDSYKVANLKLGSTKINWRYQKSVKRTTCFLVTGTVYQETVAADDTEKTDPVANEADVNDENDELVTNQGRFVFLRAWCSVLFVVYTGFRISRVIFNLTGFWCYSLRKFDSSGKVLKVKLLFFKFQGLKVPILESNRTPGGPILSY